MSRSSWGRVARGLGLPYQVTYRLSLVGSTFRPHLRLNEKPAFASSTCLGSVHVLPWSEDERYRAERMGAGGAGWPAGTGSVRPRPAETAWTTPLLSTS